jgi:electron transfer flavoprotein alpha subunit
MKMSRNVLVIAEAKDGRLRNVTFETIAAGKTIANGGKISVAALGSSAASYSNELAHYGADEIILIQNKELDQYTPDGYAQVLTALIRDLQPDAILLGHTAIGKDIAPRVAARLGLGLITDCTQIEADGDEITFIRPIYAGKAFQKKRFTEGTLFATVRPNNIAPLDPDASRTASQREFSVEIKELRSLIKEVVKKAASGVDLSEAKIIVSGGRGVKSAEGFKPLQELANVLGGAVGASRGACDAGYCDYSLQIGQTGKVVTPDLYIACGISGAIQHLAGMSNSKVIVAINKDPEAPIFQIADYGIVGDLFEVVPMLTEEFKKVLGK